MLLTRSKNPLPCSIILLYLYYTLVVIKNVTATAVDIVLPPEYHRLSVSALPIGFLNPFGRVYALVYELFKENGYKPAKKYADDFRVYLKLLDAVGYVDCPEITEELIRSLKRLKS